MEIPYIPLDPENENWLRTWKLERLREAGWKGSLAEYYDEQRRTGVDPLIALAANKGAEK